MATTTRAKRMTLQRLRNAYIVVRDRDDRQVNHGIGIVNIIGIVTTLMAAAVEKVKQALAAAGIGTTVRRVHAVDRITKTIVHRRAKAADVIIIVMMIRERIIVAKRDGLKTDDEYVYVDVKMFNLQPARPPYPNST